MPQLYGGALEYHFKYLQKTASYMTLMQKSCRSNFAMKQCYVYVQLPALVLITTEYNIK